jgi:hypothetical protein
MRFAVVHLLSEDVGRKPGAALEAQVVKQGDLMDGWLESFLEFIAGL